MWPNRERRILDTLCIASYLARLPNRLVLLRACRDASEVCAKMGLHLTLDTFRQVCTLDLLRRFVPAMSRGRELTLLMIGDGLGLLSGLIKQAYPDATLVLVDIGRTLLFQAYYCQKGFPTAIHARAESVADPGDADFVYCPAEELAHLERFRYDVAVNIASMQEMNTQTIERYFSLLRRRSRRDNVFYCCNRESKTLAGGEVVRFHDYPWAEADRIIVDGPCPWHRYFFSRERRTRGPTVFGRRVPLVSYFDGTLLHRLVVLATDG